MTIDGKKIAEQIKKELRKKFAALGCVPSLAVIAIGEDVVTDNFIHIKQKFGEAVGVPVKVFRFKESSKEKDILKFILSLNTDKEYGGIIVQLPLPEGFKIEKILRAVSPEKDVDVLGGSSVRRGILSPVVGAVKKILEVSDVNLKEKTVLVIGKGRLVGTPVAEWFKGVGGKVENIEKGERVEEFSKMADIIVSGAGVPYLIGPDMVRENSVLIDAGTSAVSGKIVGDADPACAEKCSVFTPVPGGVGPITVAKLFENLYQVSHSDTENEK